jgi:hypothetical protein
MIERGPRSPPSFPIKVNLQIYSVFVRMASYKQMLTVIQNHCVSSPSSHRGKRVAPASTSLEVLKDSGVPTF